MDNFARRFTPGRVGRMVLLVVEAVGEDGGLARKPLVIDELGDTFERFRLLRKSDAGATDELLEGLGAASEVERDIILQLSATRPLGHPERFVESHGLALRALEVLDRNGSRGVKAPKQLGPLRPIASFFLQLVTRFLVKQHQRSVIDSIKDLYLQRLAWCRADDPARPLLLRANRDVQRAADTFKNNPIGVPTFLLGGALVSGLGSLLRAASDAAGGSKTTASVALGVLTIGLGALAWTILRAAAVARRRIRLTVEGPLSALWETIGRAGKPPQDQARQFAVYAIVITALAWIVVPAGILYVLAAID